MYWTFVEKISEREFLSSVTFHLLLKRHTQFILGNSRKSYLEKLYPLSITFIHLDKLVFKTFCQISF